MTQDQINKKINESIVDDRYYDFSEKFLDELTVDEGQYIHDISQDVQMFKLPEKEIKFFDWLKEKDPKVWNDLWGVIDEKPYLVSTLFLPVIKSDPTRGFPICDLLDEDNYFFAEQHVTDEESKVFIDVAKRKLESRKRMTIEELLMLEISTGPIDIWHFAYKFNLELDDCKVAVENLKNDEALVHLKDAEHLVPFIEF